MPPVQVYAPPLPAPEPLKITGDPSHTVCEEPPTTLMLGKAFTVTVISTCGDTQSLAFFCET